METKAVYNINIGIIAVVAPMRVFTKYLKGFTAETSIASICSVTRMEPSSAPMLDPTLPAQIIAVTNGANDFITAIATRDGSHDWAPNSASEGRDCLVNTTPVIKPVSVINANDLLMII